MGVRTWPDDWERRRGGDGCPMCAEGRPDVDAHGNLRFFAGAACDAYLQREAPALGYSTVRAALSRAVVALPGTPVVFTSTNGSNAPMRALLARSGWLPSGRVSGLDEGDDELFFRVQR